MSTERERERGREREGGRVCENVCQCCTCVFEIERMIQRNEMRHEHGMVDQLRRTHGLEPCNMHKRNTTLNWISILLRTHLTSLTCAHTIVVIETIAIVIEFFPVDHTYKYGCMNERAIRMYYHSYHNHYHYYYYHVQQCF